MISKNKKHHLAPIDLSEISILTEQFLQEAEIKAKNLARYELNALWTKYRIITVEELKKLKVNKLPVSDAIIVNKLKHMLKTNDLEELGKLYDRILGKAKEYKEEKIINDVEFSIDILKNPNETES